MLPGTVPPFGPEYVKGAVVAVASTANPLCAIAVGVLEMNLKDIEVVQGKTGVAVKILHYLGDKLWEKASNIEIPDNHELEKRREEFLASQDSTVANDDSHPQTGETESKADSAESQDGNLEAAENEKGTPGPAKTEESLENTVTTLSTADIDSLFKKAFLATLYSEQVSVPISASNFVSLHLLKNLPHVPPHLEPLLVMKKTSWKKTAKFLKEMEKAKLLKLKGKDENLTILEVATKSNNEEVRCFVPHRVKKTSKSTPSSSNSSEKLSIVILYKPTSKSKPIFSEIGENPNYYFTPKDITSVVNKYISKKGLVNPKNKKTIVLDPLLSSLISSTTRDKIVPDLLKLFTLCYKVLKAGESIENIDLNEDPPVKGAVPKIHILSEYKLGRKIVTKCSNFETFGVVTPDELSQFLKVKCSGSATVGPSKQNPKLQEVMIQGPHIPVIREFFLSKGIKESYMDIVDKTKSKANKK